MEFFRALSHSVDVIGIGSHDTASWGPAPQSAPEQSLGQLAPELPSIRERFQQRAYNQLGAANRSEFMDMDPRLRNTMITGAYADMYMRNEDSMKWAGMAAYASDLVGVGISGTDVAGAIPGLPAGMDLAGVDNERLRAALARGNAGVYDDLMWQHMAMQEGGIETLRAAAEAEEIPPEQIAGWEQVAAGKQALDEARSSGDEEAVKRAQDQIWGGNNALLKYEQQVFLQKLVYDASPEDRELFERISPAMLSPIPGGESFQNYRDRTRASGSSDIGERDQRWDWIRDTMAPSYRDREENQHDSMERDMRRFSANSSTGLPGLPVNAQHPLDFELPTAPGIPGMERARKTVDDGVSWMRGNVPGMLSVR